ncbi:hypothetical protein JL722_10868 [Aureococcus anophagefferens]|nr:hypothetical protein JL722_10868 [Aureococcus anophagefferens]
MAAAVRLVDDGLKARNTAPPAIKPYKPVCAANNAAYAAANVQAASRSVCDALAAAGVALVHDFISADEEAALLETVDGGAWEGTLSRRVQHYGHRFVYESKTCAPVDRPLPPMFRAVCGRLPRRPWANDGAAQVTVNEYEPGQGISPAATARLRRRPLFADARRGRRHAPEEEPPRGPGRADARAVAAAAVAAVPPRRGALRLPTASRAAAATTSAAPGCRAGGA